MNSEKSFPSPSGSEQVSLKDFYELHKDRVYNVAVSYVRNRQDAEEITQDVFIEIHNSIGKFKGESNINTWVYRITVNKSLDFIRFTKRKKRFAFLTSIFNPETGKLEIDHSDFIHPGVEIEKQEQSRILFRAIDKLPENQKTAFILSKVEDLSYSEISEIMKTSVSSVESLLFRARQNLRKSLSRYYDGLK